MINNYEIEISIFSEFINTCLYDDVVISLLNCLEKTENMITRSTPINLFRGVLLDQVRQQVDIQFGHGLYELARPGVEVMNLIKLYQMLKNNEFEKAIPHFEKMDQDLRDIVPRQTYSWMYQQFEKMRT